MDPEDEKQSKSIMEKGKEKLQSAGEKAEKAKRNFKIFMKLPTPVKIAIIAIPLVIIGLTLLFSGGMYVLNELGWEYTYNAKLSLIGGGTSGDSGEVAENGTGYSYSEKVVQMNNGKWDLNITDDNYKQQLTDAGFNINNMTQDEMIIQLLILNGLDTEIYSEEELELLPYLIKAELASQQLDLRSADEMYSKDKYNAPDTSKFGENEIQGTVHLKRINSQNLDEMVLSYIDYETFKGYSQGEVDDKKTNEAKKYFSFNNDGNLVIYTWNHTKYSYENKKGIKDVPDDKKGIDRDEYNLQETVIDYKPLVSKYTLPFEVLTALLITSENYDFVKQVADLAFTSNIEIALIEEYTEDNTTNSTMYYETIRKYQYVRGSITVNGETTNPFGGDAYTLIHNETDNSNKNNVNCKHEGIKHAEKYTEQKENFSAETPTYTVVETIYTETNNYKYGVTLADTWFAKIEKQLDKEEKSNNTSSVPYYSEGTFECTKDAYKTGTSVDGIKKISKNTANYIDDFIGQQKSKVSIPIIWDGGAKIAITHSTTIKKITLQKVSYVYASGFEEKIYTDVNANKKEIFFPGLEDYNNIIIEDINGNTFTFKDFINTKNNIKSTSSLELTTYEYTKIDTRITTKNDKTTWIVKETATNKDLYDAKDEKFLKAIDDNGGKNNLLFNVPGWLFEMTDKYDSDFTTIIGYLMDMYLYGSSDYDIDDVLDLYGMDGFSSIGGGTYGNGTGWWWPIGDGPDGKPISTTISSDYGYRNLTGARGNFHGGIDISVQKGTAIIATKDGVVKQIQSGFGDGALNKAYLNKANYVIIEHSDGMISKYWHLSQVNVNVGDTVKQGQTIGLSGNSGYSSGPHLHFEICNSSGDTVNPNNYVSADNPRPASVAGGLSEQLYAMLLHFEGGTQHITSNGDYEIFNNGIDKNYELTCGVAVGYMGYGSYYPTLVPNPQVGQIVTKDIYNQIFEMVCKQKFEYVDKACIKYGVTLTENQRDAVFLFVYNMSDGSKTADGAIKAYKNGGAEAYYQYTKDCSISSVQSRRAKEYELFKNGTYIK